MSIEDVPAEKAPARRGRPRQYEQRAALDAALTTFWSRGFAGTSLDDLASAMRMNKPSIYAAFGNKDALYAAAVEHYLQTVGGRFLEPLLRGRTLALDLEGFYAAVIEVVTGALGPVGCIVACTLPAEAETTPGARDLLAGALARIDEVVRQRLASAVAAGELPDGTDLHVQAQLVASGMLALSLRARSGASKRDLRRLARAFVAAVRGRA